MSGPDHPRVPTALFVALEALARVSRLMHPPYLEALVAGLSPAEQALQSAPPCGDAAIDRAVQLALTACAGLRGAPDGVNPMRDTYRALRAHARSLEALTERENVPAVSCYLLEPGRRDDAGLLARLTAPRQTDSGVFHHANDTAERGGFSVYVPPTFHVDRPLPLVMALHGGSGHGRLFLWNWVAAARTRELIIVAPTAIGDTWSLMRPETDSQNLTAILARVRGRWSVDPSRLLLTGMSDGGTFTLASGVGTGSPFTHLAPVAASFHPMLLGLADLDRLAGLPVRLTHGALDWMFPVGMARTAQRVLASAGAAVEYREVADLSHAWPNDEQAGILDWFLGSPAAPAPA